MKNSSLPCCVKLSSTPLLPLLLSALPSLTVSVSDPVANEKTLNIFVVATSKEVILNPSTPTQQKTFLRLRRFCLLNFANVKFTLYLLFAAAALLDILMTVVVGCSTFTFVCPQHVTSKVKNIILYFYLISFYCSLLKCKIL